MNNFKTISVSILAVLIVLPGFALAGPIVRSGETVSVVADQVVGGDFYAAGGTVTISGTIEGDAHIAGGSVTINAPVTEDVTIIGGTTQIHADIADDVRVLGGEITIAGVVEGDVAVVGGVLHILSTAEVKGDILFMGGQLTVEGPVTGSIFGYADTIDVNASIGGNITVTAERGLSLGDRTEVLGDISYTGSTDIVRAQGAVVVGNIQEDTKIDTVNPQEVLLGILFATLFGALLMLLIMKSSLQQLVAATEKSYGMQGLVGLAVFLGVPFVAGLLIVSMLGAFAGIVMFAGYITLIFATWLATGIVLGAFSLRFFKKKLEVNVLSVALGTLVFGLILFIPFIGPLLIFAAFLIVLGGIATSVYRTLV